MKRRRAHALAVLVAALPMSLVVAPEAFAHTGTCVERNLSASGMLSSGQTKSYYTFNDSNPADGVPDTFSASDDFNQSHCHRSVSADGEIHYSRLYDETSNAYDRPIGDLSIYRLHQANGGQGYYLAASVNIWNYGGDFRGVLKLTAWDTPDTCLRVNNKCWEAIAKICKPGVAGCDATDDGTYKQIATSGTLPSGTNYVKFVWRARAASTDAYGTAGLDYLYYRRS